MKYFTDKNTTLYLGNCLGILKEIPNNSIDSIITDPPYGYNFMGKDWDKAVPSIDIWKECLRVLKPGTFAFIICTPRQDCLSRMIINLQDAGFKTDFTSIYWVYSSGFPKATNISKVLDKKLGHEREIIETRKVTENMAKMSKDSQNKEGYPKNPRPKDNYWTGNILDNNPISDQAKKFDGSYAGFQPKPAVEIIIVVMKPLSEKTFAEQALNNGRGITWLDDCRIPIKDIENEPGFRPNAINHKTNKGKNSNFNLGGVPQNNGYHNINGRFPANLLISDDILNDGQIRSSGSGIKNSQKYSTCFNGFKNDYDGKINYLGDSGSFSRYFDLDFWFGNKIKDLPENIQKIFPFIIESKVSSSEKNKGLEFSEYKIGGGIKGTEDKSLKTGSGNERNNMVKNIHPCIKPIKLMSYLITLGSRENNIILDPFLGSGSTGIAAKLLNRNFIGIEKEENYIKIAEQRIKFINTQENII